MPAPGRGDDGGGPRRSLRRREPGLKGTLANSAAIALGGAVGLLARRRFAERYRSIAVQAVGLCVVLVGLQMALKAENLLVVIGAMTGGALLGEAIDIERRLQRLGEGLKRWARMDHSGFVDGFVTASLIFCVGSMAIVGSIEEGLRGNPSILYAKAFIDGVFSMAAAASMGVGVLFSAASVFLYQGAMTLCAARLGAYATVPVVDSLSAVGGLLIFAIGINILELAKIRVGNLLPAIFLAGLLRYAFP